MKFPFGMPYFQGRTVSFLEGILLAPKTLLYPTFFSHPTRNARFCDPTIPRNTSQHHTPRSLAWPKLSRSQSERGDDLWVRGCLWLKRFETTGEPHDYIDWMPTDFFVFLFSGMLDLAGDLELMIKNHLKPTKKLTTWINMCMILVLHQKMLSFKIPLPYKVGS